jgi:hypothetical protein
VKLCDREPLFPELATSDGATSRRITVVRLCASAQPPDIRWDEVASPRTSVMCQLNEEGKKSFRRFALNRVNLDRFFAGGVRDAGS